MPPSNQIHSQHLAYGIHQSQNPGSLSLHAHTVNDPPLTSATYIPGRASFGPGVGIPPLNPNDDKFFISDRPGYSYEPDTARYDPQDYYIVNRQHQLPPAFRDQLDTTNGSAPNTSLNLRSQTSHQHSQTPTRENSSRQTSSAVSGGFSAQEAEEKWPLDRVIQWLAHNGFSSEWQETFKSLEIKGADFIDLGCGGANGLGNFGKMHQDVYPQLAKECVKNGTGWDQTREREEGIRIRKLIRSISESKQSDNATSGRYYDIHKQPSSSVEGGVETSPNPYADPFPPFEPASNDSGHQEGTLRSEISRNILSNAIGERRRNSPSTSSDHGGAPGLRPSTNRSRGGSPAAQYASVVTAEPATVPGELGHNKRNSSDSIMNRTFRSEKHDDMVSKDHKGLFNTLFKRMGHDMSHPSPEESNTDSPTSPAMAFRHLQSNLYSGKPTQNASEISLAFGISTESHARKVIQNPPPKRYIFVTRDGWNYRLVDVTDVDAANVLRARLCNGVGIKDPGSAFIYVTEPGQVEHEEPLSDTMLVVNQRSRSDASGGLKLLIQSAEHASIGSSFSERVAKGARSQKATFEEETRKRFNQASNARRISPSVAHRPSMQQLSSYSPPNPDQDRPVENSTDTKDRTAAIQAAYEDYCRTVEQKQNAFLQSKREQLQKKQASPATADGTKRGGFVDFDARRTSPFEDKRTENLIPQRKPPTAPSKSETLEKVNSLKLKDSNSQGPNQRRPSKDFLTETRERSSSFSPKPAVSPSKGIGAALTSMGKISGSIAKPLSFGHSPRTPSGSENIHFPQPQSADTGSAGSHRASPASPRLAATRVQTPMFSVPNYNSESTARRDFSNGSASTVELTTRTPVATDFADGPQGAQQSRLSHGPDFDFKETEVLFAKSPQPAADDSDDDSDSGLFAIPIAASGNKPPAKRKPSLVEGPRARSTKPSLTVNTNSRAAKGLSVTIKSPGPSDTYTPVTEYSDTRSGQHSGDPDTDDLSPEDSRSARRRSFVRDDVWASRPPVDGMIDHLDDFFPNIDLDEPYIEGMPLTPPMSPTAADDSESAQSLRDRANQSTSIPGPNSRESSDTLGSDESTLTAKNAGKSVAQRNISRAGGLSRMKSIREVAKGANQVRRNQSIAASKNLQSGMLRRKSTKMFGARIMQISPKPGSRLSDLDPLPQHPVPQEKLPQRQPTFRIIRGQLIGKGTYGRVYLGMNAETGEILAVKQVEVNQKAANYDKDRIKEMVAALDQEIDTMQHLEHPNIVQYLGCHRSDLSISIYLEYISGGSIGSCLRKHGKFEESVVQSLTIQTLRGLAYLHNEGILHRDLKADNILLDLDGTCKISDFGISKKTDNPYGNDVTNSMQGSVFWMAPEVVQSQGRGYSAKVDIWSLGCVVLEMFAGRRPWSKEEAIGAIFKLGSLNQAPPIPDDVSVNIAPAALAFMYDCFTM